MSKSNKKIIKNSVNDALFLSLLIFSGIAPAYAVTPSSNALPVLDTVVSGGLSASTSGATETFTQSTNSAIGNFKSFDIGSNATVNIVQPSTTSKLLARVTGSESASQIFGTLNANGVLFLVNTNGVVFGKGSKENVGGMIATTSDINNSDFNDGIYAFRPTANGNPSSSINTKAQVINNGTITVNQDNSLVALVGHDVENNGIIQAKVQVTDRHGNIVTQSTDSTNNTVELAGADSFTVDLNGDSLIRLAVNDPNAKNLLVQNSGQILANSGTVLMTAAVAENTINSLINMTGIIEADTVTARKGKVQLISSGSKSQLTVTGNISGNNSAITVKSANTHVAKGASLHAKNGGSVETTGTNAIQVDAGVDVQASTWSINSRNVEIANTSDGRFVSASTVANSLNKNTNITVTANGTGADGNVAVNAGISKIQGGDASLSLNATKDIVFGEDVSVASHSGKLNVVMNADTDKNNGGAVMMESGSSILSNGGNVKATGTGDNKFLSGITLDDATVDADGGYIQFNGTGAFGAGADRNGITLENGSVLETTKRGNIMLTGTAGSNFVDSASISPDSVDPSYGVYFDDATVSTEKGNITITGIAGESDVGIGAFHAEKFLLSFLALSSANLVGGEATTGNITFIADTIDVGNALAIQTSANVTFKPYTTTTSIGIAGDDGQLQITSDILDNVTASSITIGDTTDTGGIAANAYDWSANAPAVSFLNSGEIILDGMQTLGAGTLFVESTNSDITLGEEGGASSTAEGTPIILDATNGNFTNNNESADALSTPNGRWLVYSTSPEGDNFGNLNVDFEQFSAPYATAPAQDTGNGALFTNGLALDANLTGTVEKTYDTTTDATLDSSNFLLNSGYTGTFAYDNASYATPNAGNNITVTANGIVVTDVHTTGGAKVYGYTVNNSTASADIGIIDPAALTITADPQTKVYGSVDPALTYTESGLLGSDSITGGLNRDAGEHVANGPYAINQGNLSAGSNYTINYIGNFLTITPATLSVSADAQTKVYGSADPALTYVASGLQFEDTSDTVLTGGLSRDAGEHVANGPYAINQGTLTSNADYTISYAGSALDITPATLTVIADNQHMIFGSTLPALTYTFSGLQNGDDNSVFTGGLRTVPASSVVGFYPINQGTLQAGFDYTISYTPGTLTIAAPGTIFNVQDKINTPIINPPGTNGILLALSNGGLGNLNPAAGGNPPIDYSNLTPDQLAGLNPTAGGPNVGGLVPIIECNDITPCGLNQ